MTRLLFLALGLLLLPLPAFAISFVYSLDGTSSGFEYDFVYTSTSGPILHDVLLVVPAASLDSCISTPACDSIDFNASVSPARDSLLFKNTGSVHPFFNFADGAFDTPGVYASGVGGGSGTLTVTQIDSPTPVPEPATLTLIGTGLAIAALRRRRSTGT